MIIRSKAPLRISFAGGGTDVPPYPEEKGGVVLCTTIDKFAYASIAPRTDSAINVHSLDYDVLAHFDVDDDLLYNGELDLVKGVLRNMHVDRGLDLFLHSDAPPGSGLGSSSAMTVALIGAAKHWLRKPMTDYDIAELAYFIERLDLRIKGGLQDQYASSFGGFNFIEFFGDTTVVNTLRIDHDTINELQYLLLLCYTGKTRLSANILEHQISNYVEKKEGVASALDELKAITIEMKNALLQGRLNNFGEMLHHEWENKKKLSDRISNSHIDEMYEAARKSGAIGGKILGAGGGGYLLVFCAFDKKHIVAERLQKLGGQLVEFSFEPHGLQTWSIQ